MTHHLPNMLLSKQQISNQIYLKILDLVFMLYAIYFLYLRKILALEFDFLPIYLYTELLFFKEINIAQI